jgi:hypothetical protein
MLYICKISNKFDLIQAIRVSHKIILGYYLLAARLRLIYTSDFKVQF